MGTIEILWKQRDNILEYEGKNNIKLRTSKEYIDIQEKIDNYFFPKLEKTIKVKQKRNFIQDDYQEWLT